MALCRLLGPQVRMNESQAISMTTNTISNSFAMNDLETALPTNMPPPVNLSDAPFEKFAVSNKLPVELRLKIWKLLAPEPRFVELRFKYPRGKLGHTLTHRFVADIPPLPHIYFEFRQEGLKLYKVTFENAHATDLVCLNNSTDTLYISRFADIGQETGFVELETIRDDLGALNSLALTWLRCSSLFRPLLALRNTNHFQGPKGLTILQDTHKCRRFESVAELVLRHRSEKRLSPDKSYMRNLDGLDKDDEWSPATDQKLKAFMKLVQQLLVAEAANNCFKWTLPPVVYKKFRED